MPVKHAFTSAKSDGGDATLVRPSNWNADHQIGSLLFNATGATLTVTPSTDQDDYNPAGLADAAELCLAPTANVVLSGIAAPSAARLLVVRNTSDNFLVILEDQNTSSSAANRFDFRNPVFLLPGSSVSLWYDTTASRWKALTSSGGIGFGAFFDLYEDFGGSLGCWGTAVNGTGASAQISTYLQNNTERPLGVWQIDTGTTNTGRAHLGFAQTNSVVAGLGQAVALTRLAVEATSNGTERFQIFAGFHDAVGATNVTDGAYWLYDDAASANWQGATAQASTRTTTGAAGPAADANYIWLGVHLNAGWTRANYFYSTDSVNWLFGGTQTTNLPSGTQYTGFGVTINKTVGTTQRNCSIDLLGLRYDCVRG